MHEGLDLDQRLRLGGTAQQVRRNLDHVARVREARLGTQLQQPIRQQRLRSE